MLIIILAILSIKNYVLGGTYRMKNIYCPKLGKSGRFWLFLPIFEWCKTTFKKELDDLETIYYTGQRCPGEIYPKRVGSLTGGRYPEIF